MGVGGQRHAPAVLPPGKRLGALCIEGWVLTVLLLLQASPVGEVDVSGLKVSAYLRT
jgi:hypothetical protein